MNKLTEQHRAAGGTACTCGDDFPDLEALGEHLGRENATPEPKTTSG